MFKSAVLLLVLSFTQLAIPACAQEFILGAPVVVPEPKPALPIFPFSPDGHIAYLRDGDHFQMFWSGSTTYRTRGSDIFHMDEVRPVLFAGVKGSFDNGGAWLYSVFRRGKSLLGFYHAEDHEFKADPSSRFTAWKSIALAASGDNGATWSKHDQIITAARPKPDAPAWGGNGDFSVVWDAKNLRWVCYYQEHYLCMAISIDPQALPGSWRKYYNGAFTEPGLGGRNSPIPGLSGHPGGNPSVHYNSFLRKWVMVWHTWEGASLWISTSDDMLQWTQPRLLLKPLGQEKFWYPTIIGSSDVEAGRKALLCYAFFADGTKSERRFIARQIEFQP